MNVNNFNVTLIALDNPPFKNWKSVEYDKNKAT